MKSRQLEWYQGDQFRQDQDLINFIADHHVHRIKFLGNTDHVQSVLDRESQDNHDLCVYMVNSTFRFSDVVQICNQELSRLPTNGFMYLSINKFLAAAEPLEICDEDYDLAIYNYISRSVSAYVLRYYSGKIDGGRRFNWAHPLTRFYFLNAHDR